MGYTMDIYTAPGRKVIFMGVNGYDYERAEALKLLTVDASYTVNNIEVNSSSSYVEFEELPGERFNSVMFKDLVLT